MKDDNNKKDNNITKSINKNNNNDKKINDITPFESFEAPKNEKLTKTHY